MNIEGYIALFSAIGLPASIFALQSFIDRRVDTAATSLHNSFQSELKEFRLEHKIFRAQISQLQTRIALLSDKAGLERDSGFLRDVD